jgi:hypothetical protein
MTTTYPYISVPNSAITNFSFLTSTKAFLDPIYTDPKYLITSSNVPITTTITTTFTFTISSMTTTPLLSMFTATVSTNSTTSSTNSNTQATAISSNKITTTANPSNYNILNFTQTPTIILDRSTQTPALTIPVHVTNIKTTKTTVLITGTVAPSSQKISSNEAKSPNEMELTWSPILSSEKKIFPVVESRTSSLPLAKEGSEEIGVTGVTYKEVVVETRAELDSEETLEADNAVPTEMINPEMQVNKYYIFLVLVIQRPFFLWYMCQDYLEMIVQ